MAKQTYKIAAGLDQSYGSMEIAIQSKDGLGAKPLPISVILTYVGSILLCFFMCTKTSVQYGSPVQIGLFVFLWIVLTLVLARYDKTKRMQITLVPTLISYLPRVSRVVSTRKSSPADAFYSIAGINSIDANTGLVSYVDGSYGFWYRVVGSASLLLFDSDKTAILDRVDAFYRKLGTDVEIIFKTTKEAQKVHAQIANLKRRYDNLSDPDPDLLLLADEQLYILRDFVGGSFKSIHQYMIIKGDNKESLLMTKNIVQSEIENSTRMLRQCTALYKTDIDNALKVVYKGVS